MYVLMLTGLLAALPPTRATFDFLFNWYLVSGLLAGGFVMGLFLFSAFRYRAREGAPAPQRKAPQTLKIVAAVVLIMAMILIAAGYQTFASAGNIEVPRDPNAVTIKVNAFQWGWNFTYPDGKSAINNLTVPAGRVVILNITSRDVWHSFGIPSLAVKEDAIPGKLNQLWFQVDQPGIYLDAIRCYELCGIGHAFMIGNLTVVGAAQWSAWMSAGAA